MNSSMKWVGAAALVLATLSGCGGGSDPSAPPPATTPVGQAIATAAALPANDSATSANSAFKVVQSAGVPAVIVNGAPVVNFAVFSDGLAKRDLALSNVSFAIAKLVPGVNGDIDRWVSYVYRTETAAAGFGPGGTPVLPTALQATNDPKPAGLANQLVFNQDGYYTYTFSTNITDPASTSGVVFEPNRTHRIAIQLSYTNRAGEVVRVNPYFDVTFDANGRSVPVTDPTKTRVMADTSSCNGCHDKLAIHGGGRVDVQYCVMCHNPSTVDANSGNVLTMSTMTHKIHAGRLLKSQFDAGQGGEEYVIWGFRQLRARLHRSRFPQDLRNCSVCHTAANPSTPQGDLWKTKASKEACATCHSDKPGSSFYSATA
jgi:OmcA/MtrC family decaheme c-type cytochrome